jgi:hypothetical protein
MGNSRAEAPSAQVTSMAMACFTSCTLPRPAAAISPAISHSSPVLQIASGAASYQRRPMRLRIGRALFHKELRTAMKGKELSMNLRPWPGWGSRPFGNRPKGADDGAPFFKGISRGPSWNGVRRSPGLQESGSAPTPVRSGAHVMSRSPWSS